MRKIFHSQQGWFAFLTLTVILLWAAVGDAAPLVRSSTSADYAAGAKAVGTKINAEFNTLFTWLNGQNITSSNIANQGLDTQSYKNLSITGAKVAAKTLTRDNIADRTLVSTQIALGGINTENYGDQTITINKMFNANINFDSRGGVSYSKSYSGGGFTEALPNSEVSLITYGARPIRVWFQNDFAAISGPTVATGGVVNIYGTAVGENIAVGIFQDGVKVANIPFTNTNGASGSRTAYPCNVISTVIFPQPLAGTHQYTAKVILNGAGPYTFEVFQCRMYAMEM